MIWPHVLALWKANVMSFDNLLDIPNINWNLHNQSKEIWSFIVLEQGNEQKLYNITSFSHLYS